MTRKRSASKPLRRRRRSRIYRLCAIFSIVAAVGFAAGVPRVTRSTSASPALSALPAPPNHGPCRSDPEPPLLVGALAAHNTTRARAAPAPDPPLPQMCWSATVADIAQRYADECRYRHSRTNGLGENIYSHSGDVSDRALTTAIQRWSAEAADYDYRSNSCFGDACGHYTQMVWRDSHEIGCGVSVCERNSPFGSKFPVWTMVVCNYRGPGNFVGRKPY